MRLQGTTDGSERAGLDYTLVGVEALGQARLPGDPRRPNQQSLLKRARTEARYANFTVRVATTLPSTSMLNTTRPWPSWRKARLDR